MTIVNAVNRRILSPQFVRISSVFSCEYLRFVRFIRSYLLKLAGVSIDGTDFFADTGLRILFPWNLTIGENVSLGNDNHLWCFNSVRIGKWTQTAKDLLIIAGGHRTDNFEPISGREQEVEIGSGCWIGARVTILGGTRIGNGSIVAAGAVVRGDFPPFSIIGGVPAKILKMRNPSCQIKNPFGIYKIDDLDKRARS